MGRAIQVFYSPVVKACRSSLVLNPEIISKATPTPTPGTKKATAGNPCLYLFCNVRLEYDLLGRDPTATYTREYLKQLLPRAWAHNLLTTLKLIGNLRDRKSEGHGKEDEQGFFTAAYWLYQNHPKTLAYNVANFEELGGQVGLLEILYRALEGLEDDVHGRRRRSPGGGCLNIFGEIRQGSATSSENDAAAMAEKAIQRYRLDPNYRLLHDRISDLYAHCFKHDLENLKNYHENDKSIETGDPTTAAGIEMTTAAMWCPYVDSTYDRATLLCQSIANKVFPEEAAAGVRLQRLRDEVLVPLRNVLEYPKSATRPNRWGYCPGPRIEPCRANTYLEEVKAGGIMSKIKAGALLPHEILELLDSTSNQDDNKLSVAAAELQWKATVEEIYLKQGTFKHCLVVRASGFFPHLEEAYQLLASQLVVDPWKGKMMHVSSLTNQHLVLCSIQGDDDHIKSKVDFARSLGHAPLLLTALVPQVFDLILEMAVTWNLKPEQMINKVLLFPSWFTYPDDFEQFWEREYVSIHNKFKSKGYGHVVPHLVVWRAFGSSPWCSTERPGLTLVRGLTNSLVQCFLDNDGHIGPEQVMESAISGERYADFVVLD